MSIEKKSYELVDLIRETKEFKDVQIIKGRIAKNTTLLNDMKKFQYNQKKLYRQRLPENEMEKRMKTLQSEYEELQKNNEVRQYTQALQRLNERIYSINQRIYDILENDILL